VSFVAEIGSRSSQREDEGPKVEIYQDRVRAREYLYADPPRGVLRLWRMDATGTYTEVAAEADGRVRSAELDLEFGTDEAGFLRAYTIPDGEMLLTHEEEAELRQEAESRAAEETRRREELEREIAALRARLGEPEE
jgi:hypothetical protein